MDRVIIYFKADIASNFISHYISVDSLNKNGFEAAKDLNFYWKNFVELENLSLLVNPLIVLYGMQKVFDYKGIFFSFDFAETEACFREASSLVLHSTNFHSELILLLVGYKVISSFVLFKSLPFFCFFEFFTLQIKSHFHRPCVLWSIVQGNCILSLL